MGFQVFPGNRTLKSPSFGIGFGHCCDCFKRIPALAVRLRPVTGRLGDFCRVCAPGERTEMAAGTPCDLQSEVTAHRNTQLRHQTPGDRLLLGESISVLKMEFGLKDGCLVKQAPCEDLLCSTFFQGIRYGHKDKVCLCSPVSLLGLESQICAPMQGLY